MKRLLLLVCLAAIVLLGVACGGDKGPILSGDTPKPNVQITAPAATTGPSASPVGTSAPQASAPMDLSLVYVDSRAGTNTLFLARYDGQSPKQLAVLPNGSRPVDVRGNTLVSANGAQLLFTDLKSGDQKPFATQGVVRVGHFLDDATFLYSTAGACGGGPDGGAPPMSRLWRLDLKTMQPREIATGRGNTIQIVGLDPQAQRVAIVKYGCDPGIGEFFVLEAANGAETQRVPAMGCGNAAVSIEKKVALISWAACGSAINKPDVTAQLYDFSNAAPVGKDLKIPVGGLNNSTLLIKPGGQQVALGTQEMLTTPRAGGPRSTGLWVMDLATAAVTPAVPADGAEQYPVAWSPDGRFLLYSTVQAQGLCTTAFLDTVSKAVTKVDDKITGCGVNGTMVGWTKLSN